MKIELLKIGEHLSSGRIYPRKVVERAIANGSDYFVFSEEDGIIGTCFYSVAGVVSNVRIEDDILVGNFKSLSTPSGEELQSLIDDEVDIDFVLRGSGNVSADFVVSDLRIDGYDAVNVPSMMKYDEFDELK